jgi:hypothetical protein
LRELHSVQDALEVPTLKADEQAPTWWPRYELFVKCTVEILPAVLATLDHIHSESGDMSSTAGGVLLTMKKRSSIFAMVVLDSWLYMH